MSENEPKRLKIDSETLELQKDRYKRFFGQEFGYESLFDFRLAFLRLYIIATEGSRADQLLSEWQKSQLHWIPRVRNAKLEKLIERYAIEDCKTEPWEDEAGELMVHILSKREYLNVHYHQENFMAPIYFLAKRAGCARTASVAHEYLEQSGHSTESDLITYNWSLTLLVQGVISAEERKTALKELDLKSPRCMHTDVSQLIGENPNQWVTSSENVIALLEYVIKEDFLCKRDILRFPFAFIHSFRRDSEKLFAVLDVWFERLYNLALNETTYKSSDYCENFNVRNTSPWPAQLKAKYGDKWDTYCKKIRFVHDSGPSPLDFFIAAFTKKLEKSANPCDPDDSDDLK